MCMYRTHFIGGVLVGLAVDVGLALAGHPLPLGQAIALPIMTGHLTTIPDADHHSSWIRFAVPPARWLYLLVRLLVRLSAGLPAVWMEWHWRGVAVGPVTVPYSIRPAVRWRWSAASRKRGQHFHHRGITHWLSTAIVLGAVTYPLVRWGVPALFGLAVDVTDSARLAAFGALIAFVAPPAHLVAVAVTLACATHDLGDLPTDVPFRILAPLSWRKFALRWFKTGNDSVGERRFRNCQTAAASLLGLVLFTITIGGIDHDPLREQPRPVPAQAQVP